jgi:acetylornithine deacetylase/succinyl-diaminopimelate desuccinylase-like protein
MFETSEPTLLHLDSIDREIAASIVSSVSAARLRRDVESLIGPHNRLDSPEAMTRTEELIVSGFERSGWETKRRPFTLKNTKDNHYAGNLKHRDCPELSGVSITALKPGQESNVTLVIEAHYDTVRVSPGADDNTASVAALLELAWVFKALRLEMLRHACGLRY